MMSFPFSGAGASPDVCDETYNGQRPFSEKESRAVARYMYKRRNDLKVFVDVHTFGQLVSHPWGFSRSPSFHQRKHVRWSFPCQSLVVTCFFTLFIIIIIIIIIINNLFLKLVT